MLSAPCAGIGVIVGSGVGVAVERGVITKSRNGNRFHIEKRMFISIPPFIVATAVRSSRLLH